MSQLAALCLTFVVLASSHLRGWKKHKKDSAWIENKLNHLQDDIDFIIEELTKDEDCLPNPLEWIRVRHVPEGEKWHPINDNLV